MLLIPDGVYLSPGGGSMLSISSGLVFSISILVIVVVLLLFSVNKKRKDKK